MILVAKRAFRHRGIFFGVGEVIDDPNIIPLLRSRIGLRDVLELTPESRDLQSWIAYLESRKGTSLDDRIYALLQKEVKVKSKVSEEPKTVQKTETPEAKPVKVFGKKPE